MAKYFVEKSAILDIGVEIKEGVKIWHNTHVCSGAIIGEDTNIGQNCYIAGETGKGCKVQNNVNVYKGVKLGDYVFCGPSMTFTNDMNPRAKYPKHGAYLATIVEEGVSFGAHSTIVCGTKIGRWAMVGAGSIVTKNVPAYALVYGNPAHIQGWVCECGEKLPKEFSTIKCTKCGKKYSKKAQTVKEIKRS